MESLDRAWVLVWLRPAAVVAGFTGLGWIVTLAFLKPLERICDRTGTRLDDLMFRSVRRHVPFWFLLAGLAMGLRVSAVDPSWFGRIDRALMVAWLVSMTVIFSSLSTGLIRTYSGRFGITTTTLIENLAALFAYGMGTLLILANLGISIAPLLTALGVGSLAVALALQDTLSNLFAGLYIIVHRRIRVGDFIRLDTGEEGFVADITWRSTSIRELAGNIILIPNSKLGQATVKNFHLPDPETALLVNAGVSYGSDLKKVEQVTLEVARNIQRQVSGAVPSFEPLVRFHTFGESAVNFTVTLRVKDYAEQVAVRHEFMKQLIVAYGREGIEIPFPQQVVHLKPNTGESRT